MTRSGTDVTRLPSALRPLFPWLKTGVLHATQAVSPLTRRLPGATPPRHVAPLGGRLRARASRRWRRGRGGGRRAGSAPAASGGPPRRPPTIRGTSSRAHRAQRRRHRAARPRAGALRGGHDRGRHAPLRPLALLRRRPRRRSIPSSCAAVRRRSRTSPVRSGVLTTRGSENYYHFVTDVLPRLELLRRAGVEPDAYRREPLDPVPARPARPPRPHGRPLPGRREVSARAGRRARRAVAARRSTRARRPGSSPGSAPSSCPTTLRPPHRRLYVSRGRREAHAPGRERGGAGGRAGAAGLRGHRPRRAVAGGAGARLRRGRVHRRAARRRPDQSRLRRARAPRSSSCSPATT